VVRRLPRLRIYEAVLLLDFAIVLFLLRYRARLGLDAGQALSEARNFVAFAAPFLLAAILLRAAFAARRGRSRALARLRATLKPRALLDLARLLAAMALTSFVYSWLKVAIPLIRPDVLFDRELFSVETALHLGVNPGRFLQSLFPYPGLWRALDVYYAAFMYTVLAGVGWFAASVAWRERTRFASGFAFLWILGSWFYLAVPSLGPCYVLKDDYTEVRAAMPEQSMTMNGLFAHYGRVRTFHTRPEGTDLSPYLGVAAMPSLHVAAQAFFALFARKRSRPVFLVFTVLTAVTFFTSVVSGWHYAIDGYAALLLAWVSFAAGNRAATRA
jgi:hypothetical protein